MKIAVISDIHGNLEAFEKVLADIDAQHVDQIFCLGDNVGYGADPEAVVQQLVSRKIISVLGNHDWACINPKVYKWYVKDVKTSLDMTIARLSHASLAYLKQCTSHLNLHDAWFVHGFPPDSVRHYLHQVSEADLKKGFQRLKTRVCFVGHTHRLGLVCEKTNTIANQGIKNGTTQLSEDKKYIVNAGSVGQPRGGETKATYIIWGPEKMTIAPRFVSYDNRTAAEKILAAGMPEKFARAVDKTL